MCSCVCRQCPEITLFAANAVRQVCVSVCLSKCRQVAFGTSALLPNFKFQFTASSSRQPVAACQMQTQ